MNYELIEEKSVGNKLTRLYRNKQGTEVKTHLIYTHPVDKSNWFAFVDLFQIPVIRRSMASYITNLYSVGLTVKDILTWCEQEKKLLKSDDPEAYEKLYALILEKEKITTFTANPIKNALALTTVYILSEDERIDYFSPEESERKLTTWEGMPEAVGFFLSWQNDHIERYMKRLDGISKTVSRLEKIKG